MLLRLTWPLLLLTWRKAVPVLQHLLLLPALLLLLLQLLSVVLLLSKVRWVRARPAPCVSVVVAAAVVVLLISIVSVMWALNAVFRLARALDASVQMNVVAQRVSPINLEHNTVDH
jgi:formate hydrogenlyase subunit 4